jgi:DNA-binding NarL/FixJ family response regulator
MSELQGTSIQNRTIPHFDGALNAGIARRLWVTEGTVEKHVRSILTKLTLPEAHDDHRRVLAVLTYLDSR